MPQTVFISHAAVDKAVATSLKNVLEEELLGGVACFVSTDRKSISPGAPWFEEIQRAISRSRLMVVLCSQASVARPWVNFEAGAGHFRGIPVVPLCIRGFHKEQLPWPLAAFQGLDSDDKDDLLTLLHAVAAAVKLTPRVDAALQRMVDVFAPSDQPEMHDDPPDVEKAVDNRTGGLLYEPQLPEPEYATSTLMFSRRFANAFPGVRGLRWYSGDEAVKRLEILLHPPLQFRGVNGGISTPIMWLRGRTNLHVDSFQVLDEATYRCLLGWDELVIDSIAAYRARDYRWSFVYLETKPDAPTGAYNDTTPELIRSMVGEFGYAWEEAGYFNDRYIKSTELDDGYAEIDGMIVEVDGAHVRCRYLSPYNILLIPLASPFNDSRWDFQLDKLMRGLLDKTCSIEELVDWFERLPPNQRVYEGDE